MSEELLLGMVCKVWFARYGKVWGLAVVALTLSGWKVVAWVVRRRRVCELGLELESELVWV